MKILKVLVGSIGITSVIIHFVTKETLFFTIFLSVLPFIWGFAAYDEWRAERRFLSAFLMIVTLASIILAVDVFFIS
ncbi:hypothetical protein ACFO0S_08150 [Chryseomicrobium palamuruense]|uniref:DUF3953 domain-containing protein n=1 Tax=Chryseomicrobium palamuruense TaxID=682973 RepID=A0ABV8UW91_9BACL